MGGIKFNPGLASLFIGASFLGCAPSIVYHPQGSVSNSSDSLPTSPTTRSPSPAAGSPSPTAIPSSPSPKPSPSPSVPVSSIPAITQTITVADAAFATQIGGALEKVVGYFTSTTLPSVVVGFQPNNSQGGLYLFTSTTGQLTGPYQPTALVAAGDAYERAVAFTYPGDTYPGIIASIEPSGASNHQIIWYRNPANSGGNPLDPKQWGVQVINPSHGCHDLRLIDMDGDGKLDVVCSSSLVLGSEGENTPSFIAFQNSSTDWSLVYNIAPLADGVDAIKTAGSDKENLVGANQNDGNIYWYENPCTRTPFVQQGVPCSASRQSGWAMHKINSGQSGTAEGNAFTTVTINGVQGVITAANEEYSGVIYTPGVAWFSPGSNTASPWNMVELDNTYRDVHEINTGTWNNGIPYVIAAEQEQACPPSMPNGSPPDHQSPCRIGMFQYINGAWQQTVLSQTSTQNQYVIPYGNGLLMTGANHGFYGGDPTVYLWVIQPSN